MKTLFHNPPKLLIGLIASVALPQLAQAQGELTGRLEGTVTEAQTGAPVPGATVTVGSPSQIGGTRSVTTSEDGSYLITDLMPGSYAVEVTYSGVKPVRRQVLVRQGEATPLNIAWSAELAEAETTVVVEERHLTRPDSTMSGTVFSGEDENKIATGRTYQNVALQTAGVANPNNAGNPQIKGANLMMNKYLLDGLDVSDPILNTFSANLNFDSIQSLQVITGGMEAQYNALGGIINVISSPGSDEFHADASLYANHYKLSAPAQFGAQFYDGPKPFSDVPRPPTSRYDGNINLSGPLIKQALWFAGSFQYTDTRASQPAGPPLNVQAPNRHGVTILGRIKLTWAPNAKHRVTTATHVDPASFDFVTFSGPGANTTQPLAATRQDQGSIVSNLIWEYFINQTWGTKLQIGTQFNKLDNGPEGVLGSLDPKYGPYSFQRPQHVNLNDGITYYNPISLDVNRRRAYTADAAVTLRGRLFGFHDAQAGVQTRFLNFNRWLTRTGGGITYQDAGGGPGEGGLCDDGSGTTGVSGTSAGCFRRTIRPDLAFTAKASTVGIYLQDRWKPLPWLTILPGLRFDWGRAENNPFEGSPPERVANIYGLGPRIGALFDITGDQKTIFSAFYGRAVDVNALLAAGNTQRQGLLFTQQWNGTTWVPFTQGGGSDYYRLDPGNHTPPHTDEILLSLRRELFRNSVGQIEYTYKRISNIWDGVEVNQIYDPSGTRIIDYADGTAHSVSLITTPSKNYTTYNGIDFSIEGRPTPNVDLYGAYTLSYRTGISDEEFGQTAFLEPGVPAGGASAFTNPRQFFLYPGYLAGDVRHTFKGHGYIGFHGFFVGPNFTYRTGVTQHRVFTTLTGNSFFRSPQGTEPGTGNDPNQIAEFRTPDLLTVNVRLSYDLYEVSRQHLIFIFDVFNLLNAAIPSTIQVTNTIPIQRVGEIQARLPPPLSVQLGMRYIY